MCGLYHNDDSSLINQNKFAITTKLIYPIPLFERSSVSENNSGLSRSFDTNTSLESTTTTFSEIEDIKSVMDNESPTDETADDILDENLSAETIPPATTMDTESITTETKEDVEKLDQVEEKLSKNTKGNKKEQKRNTKKGWKKVTTTGV